MPTLFGLAQDAGKPTVLDADEVHRTYKALNEVPNLKMLL